MKLSHVGLGAVAMGCAAAAFLYLRAVPEGKRPSPQAAAAAADTRTDELTAAQKEIAELRRSVASLQARTRVVEASVAEGKAEAPAAGGTVQEPLPAQAAAGEGADAPSFAVHFKYADGYRAFVTGEARDPAWASAKERAFRDFFAAEGMQGYSLRSVECKSSACALELHADGTVDPVQDPEVIRRYLRVAPFFGAGSYWAPSDDGVLLIMSREGGVLPNPDSL